MSVGTRFFGAALSITVSGVVATDCAAQVFSASQNLQNTTITNKSGYDLGAIDIDATGGTVVGTVYMSKSMTFGDDQRPIKGSGSIAGRGFSILILPPGKHAPVQATTEFRPLTATIQGTTPMLAGVPFAKGDIPDLAAGDVPDGSLILKARLIRWDDGGNTEDIQDLQPTIACASGKQFKITSDLEHPSVKGGLLTVDTESGKLSLRIKYGSYGAAQGPIKALCGAAEPETSSVDAPEASAPGKVTAAVRKEAQQRLQSLGFDPGPADGVLGAKSVAALKKFQESRGLTASGTLDPKTLDALMKQP